MRTPSPLRRCISAVLSTVILPWQPLADSRVWAQGASPIVTPAEAHRVPDDITKDARYREFLAALTVTAPGTRRFDPKLASELTADQNEALASLRLESETQRSDVQRLRAAWAAWFLEAKVGRAQPPDTALAAVDRKFVARPLLPSEPAQRAAFFNDYGREAQSRLQQADQIVRTVGEELAQARWTLAELGDLVKACSEKPGRAAGAAQEGPRWRQRLKALAEHLGAKEPEAAIRFYLTELGFGAVTAGEVESKLRADGRLTDQEVAALAEIARKGLSADEISSRVGTLLEGARAQEGRTDLPSAADLAGLVAGVRPDLAPVASAPARRPAQAATDQARQPGLRITPPPMTVTRSSQEPTAAPRFSLTPLEGVQLAADVATGRQAAYLIERKNRLVKRAQAFLAVMRAENSEARGSFEDQLGAIYAAADGPDFEERMRAWIDTADRYLHSRYTSPEGAIEEGLLADERIRRVDASAAVAESLGGDSALMEAFRRLDGGAINDLAAKARSGNLSDREQRLWNAFNAYWEAMGEDKLKQFYDARPARKALLELDNEERAFHSDALAAGHVPPGTTLGANELDLQRLAERLGAHEALDPNLRTITAEVRKPVRVGGSDATDAAYTGVTLETADGQRTFVSADRALRETTGRTQDGKTIVLRRLFDGSGNMTGIEQALADDPRHGIRQEGRFNGDGELTDGVSIQAEAGRVTETTIEGGRRTLASTRDADGDLTGAVRYENGRPAAVWDRATGRTSYYQYVASTDERPFRVGDTGVEVTVVRRGSPDGPIHEAYYEPPVETDYGRRVRDLAGHAAHDPAVAPLLNRYKALADDPAAETSARQRAFDAVVAALKTRLGPERQAALAYLAENFGRTGTVRYNFLKNGEVSSEALDGLDARAEGEGASRREVYATFAPDGNGGWTLPNSEVKLDDRREARSQMTRRRDGSEERTFFEYADTGHPEGGAENLRVQIHTAGAEPGAQRLAASAVDGKTEYRFAPDSPFEPGKRATVTEKVVRDDAGGYTVFKPGRKSWWTADPDWHPLQRLTPTGDGKRMEQWEPDGQLILQDLDARNRPLSLLQLTGDGKLRALEINAISYRYDDPANQVIEVYYKGKAGSAPPPDAGAAVGARLLRYGQGRQLEYEANLDAPAAAVNEVKELDGTYFLASNAYLKVNRDAKTKQHWLVETGNYQLKASGDGPPTPDTTTRNRYKGTGARAWQESELEGLRTSPGVEPAKFALKSVPAGLVSSVETIDGTGDVMKVPGAGNNAHTLVLQVPPLSRFGGDAAKREEYIRQNLGKWADEMSANMPDKPDRPTGGLQPAKLRGMLTDYFTAMRGRLNQGSASVTLTATGDRSQGGVKHVLDLATDTGGGNGELVRGFFEFDNSRHFRGVPVPTWALVTKVAVPLRNGQEAPDAQWTADNVLTTSIIKDKPAEYTKDGVTYKIPDRETVVRNEFMFGDNGQIAKLQYTDRAVEPGVMVVAKSVSLSLLRYENRNGSLQLVGPRDGTALGNWEGTLIDPATGQPKTTRLGGAMDTLNNSLAGKILLHEPADLSTKLVTGVFAAANTSVGGWRRLIGGVQSLLGYEEAAQRTREAAGINEAHAWSEGLRAVGMLSSDPNKRERQIVSLADKGYAHKLTTEARSHVDDMARAYRETSLNNQGGDLWMTGGERYRLTQKRINDYERIATVGDIGFGNYGKMAGSGVFGGWAQRNKNWITAGEGVLGTLPMMIAGNQLTGFLSKAASLRTASTFIVRANKLNNIFNYSQMGFFVSGAGTNLVRTLERKSRGLEYDWSQNVVDGIFVGHSIGKIIIGKLGAAKGRTVENNAKIDKVEPLKPPEMPKQPPARPQAPPQAPELPLLPDTPVPAPAPKSVVNAPDTPAPAPPKSAPPLPPERAPLSVKAPEVTAGSVKSGGNLDSPAAGSIDGISAADAPGKSPATPKAEPPKIAPQPTGAGEKVPPAAPPADGRPPAAPKAVEAPVGETPKAPVAVADASTPAPESAVGAAPEAALAPDYLNAREIVGGNQRHLQSELTGSLLDKLGRGKEPTARAWMNESGQMSLGEKPPPGAKAAPVDLRLVNGPDGAPQLQRVKPGLLDRLLGKGEKLSETQERVLKETEKSYNQDRVARHRTVKAAETLSGSAEKPAGWRARVAEKLGRQKPEDVTAWVDPNDPTHVLGAGKKAPTKDAVKVELKLEDRGVRIEKVHAEGPLRDRVRAGVEARLPEAGKLVEARQQAKAFQAAFQAADGKPFESAARGAYKTAAAERAKAGNPVKPGEPITFQVDGFYDPVTHALGVGEPPKGSTKIRLEIEASRKPGLFSRLRPELEITRVAPPEGAPGRLKEMAGAMTLRALDRLAAAPARALVKELQSRRFRNALERAEAIELPDGRKVAAVDAYYDPRTGALNVVPHNPKQPSASNGTVRLSFVFEQRGPVNRLMGIEGSGFERLPPDVARRFTLVEATFEGIAVSAPGVVSRGWDALKRRVFGRGIETAATKAGRPGGWSKGKESWLERRDAFAKATREVYAQLEAIRTKAPPEAKLSEYEPYRTALREGTQRLKELGADPAAMLVEFEFAPLREARRAAAKSGDWTAYDEAAGVARELGVGPTARELMDRVLRQGAEAGRRQGFDATLEVARVELRDADLRVEQARLSGDAKAVESALAGYERAVGDFRKAAGGDADPRGGGAEAALKVETVRARLLRAERARIDAEAKLQGVRHAEAVKAAEPQPVRELGEGRVSIPDTPEAQALRRGQNYNRTPDYPNADKFVANSRKASDVFNKWLNGELEGSFQHVMETMHRAYAGKGEIGKGDGGQYAKGRMTNSRAKLTREFVEKHFGLEAHPDGSVPLPDVPTAFQPEMFGRMYAYPNVSRPGLREAYYGALERRVGEFSRKVAEINTLKAADPNFAKNPRYHELVRGALDTVVDFGRTAAAFRQFRNGNWGLYGPMLDSMVNRLGLQIKHPGFLDVLLQGASEKSLKPFFADAAVNGKNFHPADGFDPLENRVREPLKTAKPSRRTAREPVAEPRVGAAEPAKAPVESPEVAAAKLELDSARRELKNAKAQAKRLGAEVERSIAEDRIIQAQAQIDRYRSAGMTEEWIKPLNDELAAAVADGQKLGVDALAAQGKAKFLVDRHTARARVVDQFTGVKQNYRGQTAEVADRGLSDYIRLQRGEVKAGRYQGRKIEVQSDEACFARSIADAIGIPEGQYARFEAAVERRLGRGALERLRDQGVFEEHKGAILDVARAEFGADIRTVGPRELRAAVAAGETVSLSIVLARKAGGEGGGSHQVTARKLDPKTSREAYGIAPEEAHRFIELTDSQAGGSYPVPADMLFGTQGSGGAVSRISGYRAGGALAPAEQAAASRRLEPYAREQRFDNVRRAYAQAQERRAKGTGAAEPRVGAAEPDNPYTRLFAEMRGLARSGAADFHPGTAEPIKTRPAGPVLDGMQAFLERYGAAPVFESTVGEGMAGDAVRVKINGETYYMKRLTKSLSNAADAELRALTPMERAQNEAFMPRLLAMFPEMAGGKRAFEATSDVGILRHNGEVFVLTKGVEGRPDAKLFREGLRPEQRADYLIAKAVFGLGDMHSKNILFGENGKAFMIDGEKILRSSVRERLQATALEVGANPTELQIRVRLDYWRTHMITTDLQGKGYPIFEPGKWARSQPILERFKVWQERFQGDGPESAAFRERFTGELRDSGWTPEQIDRYMKSVAENVRDFPALVEDYVQASNKVKPLAMNPDYARKSDLQTPAKDPALHQMFMDSFQFLPPDAIVKANGEYLVNVKTLREVHARNLGPRPPPEAGRAKGTGSSDGSEPGTGAWRERLYRDIEPVLKRARAAGGEAGKEMLQEWLAESPYAGHVGEVVRAISQRPAPPPTSKVRPADFLAFLDQAKASSPRVDRAGTRKRYDRFMRENGLRDTPETRAEVEKAMQREYNRREAENLEIEKSNHQTGDVSPEERSKLGAGELYAIVSTNELGRANAQQKIVTTPHQTPDYINSQRLRPGEVLVHRTLRGEYEIHQFEERLGGPQHNERKAALRERVAEAFRDPANPDHDPFLTFSGRDLFAEKLFGYSKLPGSAETSSGLRAKGTGSSESSLPVRAVGAAARFVAGDAGFWQYAPRTLRGWFRPRARTNAIFGAVLEAVGTEIARGEPPGTRAAGSLGDSLRDTQRFSDCAVRAMFNEQAFAPARLVFQDYNRFLGFAERVVGEPLRDHGTYDRQARSVLNRLGLRLDYGAAPANAAELVQSLHAAAAVDGAVYGSVRWTEPVTGRSAHAIVISAAYRQTGWRALPGAILENGVGRTLKQAFADGFSNTASRLREEGVWRFAVTDSNFRGLESYRFSQLRSMGLETASIKPGFHPETLKPYTEGQLMRIAAEANNQVAAVAAPTRALGIFGRVLERFSPAPASNPLPVRVGPFRALRASIGPGAELAPRATATGASELPSRLGKTGSLRSEGWTMDGRPVERFAGGGFKDHLPLSDGRLLTLFTQAGVNDLRSSIRERNTEAAQAKALERAEAAPRVSETGVIGVDGYRLPNVAYLVQETVQGPTASALGQGALPHVRALFDRLTNARLKITDVGANLGDNIRVGTTVSDPRTKAYVVDRGEVESVPKRSWGDRVFGRPDPLKTHYDRLYNQLAGESSGRGEFGAGARRARGTGANEGETIPAEEAARKRLQNIPIDGTGEAARREAAPKTDGTAETVRVGEMAIPPKDLRAFTDWFVDKWTALEQRNREASATIDLQARAEFGAEQLKLAREFAESYNAGAHENRKIAATDDATLLRQVKLVHEALANERLALAQERVPPEIRDWILRQPPGSLFPIRTGPKAESVAEVVREAFNSVPRSEFKMLGVLLTRDGQLLVAVSAWAPTHRGFAAVRASLEGRFKGEYRVRWLVDEIIPVEQLTPWAVKGKTPHAPCAEKRLLAPFRRGELSLDLIAEWAMVDRKGNAAAPCPHCMLNAAFMQGKRTTGTDAHASAPKEDGPQDTLVR